MSHASVTMQSAPASGVAAALREATSAAHQHAETHGYVTALMGGELSLAEYGRYLAQYAHVYEALEARVPRDDDPWIVRDERLRRTESIAADLTALGLADWRERVPVLPATQAYVGRLQALPEDDVLAHLAHHYTRYLGDLSGGQAIAALVRRHYGATDEQLGFYRFEGIESIVHYKRDYRDALDELQLDDVALAALVAEAQVAFDLNAALFEELRATL